MAKIQEMLELNGGSFTKAEAMAKKMVADGNVAVWLDLALLYHAQGKIAETKNAQVEYAKHFPDCPRLKFGVTWLKLFDGDLEGGLEHIESGRDVGCLGDPSIGRMKKPKWDGKEHIHGKTVLLYCEGGQGDHIMGWRSVFHLANRCANVVVATSESLLPLASQVPGVVSAVTTEAVNHVHHDFWLPAMSSFRLCGMNWKTLWTGPYVFNKERDDTWDRIVPKVHGVKNVGIRWRGNPKFEHEQLRWFPPELMIGLTDVPGYKFYSLQKDDQQVLPDNVVDLEPLLGNWQCTASAIKRMDLVITCCTSIAHLSAAMGKQTWVVVPAMPYYPWARPGAKSDWYPTATVFRQECYGKWDKPFEEIRSKLLTV